MDEQDRLDGLFTAPGEAGYVPPYYQTAHPCCFDDEPEEELAPYEEPEEELTPTGR